MLQLDLPWPPALNHYYRHVVVKGVVRVLISKDGRAYRHRLAMVVVLRGRPKALTGRIRLDLHLHPPDKRERDIDGVFKALFDALTHARVWEDDSQIREMHVYFEEPVKGGRVVARIEKLA